MYYRLPVEAVAKIAHETIRAFDPDFGLVEWENLTDEHRASMMNGVEFQRNNDHPSAELNHENWMKVRLEQGWAFGPHLDRESKVHPNLRPYEELPEIQRAKNRIFIAIVKELS